MKKINFKDLSNDEILTREELKRITGGNGSDEEASDDGSGGASKCTATCKCPTGYQVKANYGSGLYYTVSITCESGCAASDNVGVTCLAPSNMQMSCATAATDMCEKIPLHT